MEPVLLPELASKRVLLGVSGGIAAYKAAELCRLLVKCDADVRVMMTAAARRFVGPVTFSALSGHSVATDLFEPTGEEQIGHVEIADQADLLIMAPATANLMARMAAGIADDLVGTVYLAYAGDVLLAPAMNTNMWDHPATRENLSRLRERGHQIVGPDSGDLACGHVGAGRMAEPSEILQAAGACLTEPALADQRILVTAGPTHEPLDPVRFLGNRSSGRMGFALAAEAAAMGARVTLVAGPSRLPDPGGVRRVDVVTAEQMAGEVTGRAGDHDAILMAAAVADYRPASRSEMKLKKENMGVQHTLELEQTRDILASLASMPGHPFLVGFAAEAGGDLEQLARTKLARKGCDMLVVNDVTAPGAGFDVATNAVTLYHASGYREEVPLMSKRRVSSEILTRVAAALAARRVAA